MVSGKALPDAVIDQIADRTGGVPLFIEELTKSVLESGLLRAEANRYAIDGALPSLAIPTSLYASLLARLDRQKLARLAAQIGAAIGREFTYGLLRAVWALAENALQAALDRLVASELVYQRGIPPDASYSFKHALVRDAAYGSLLLGARRKLHALIAETLRAQSGELMESQPELLAWHYAEAGQVDESLALLAEATEIAGRTGERWLAAELNRQKGELLQRQGNSSGAEQQFYKALTIAAEQGAKFWELRAATSLARLRREQGRPADARDVLAPVYRWFTEGFDTADLHGAKALLDELGEPSDGRNPTA